MTTQSVTTGTASLYPLSFKEGLLTETGFTQALRSAGYKAFPVSTWVDQTKHIDTWAFIDRKRYGIDIKGMKRMQRDGQTQNRYTCLELHGSHFGNKGWLYGGEADLIAFEQEDTYLLVWRKRLIDIVTFRVSNERVQKSSQAVYKVYSRRDHEEITWIETDLLRNSWVLFMEIKKEL